MIECVLLAALVAWMVEGDPKDRGWWFLAVLLVLLAFG